MASHPPSYRVVNAVAAKKGVAPTELSPPLFSAIDPEALDALAKPDQTTDPVTITFSYVGYTVRVQYGQTVSVTVSNQSTPARDTQPERHVNRND